MPGARVNFTAGFAAGLSPQEYGWRLADSKIALCPRGWESAETFRHFEALRAGTIVVSESLPPTHFYVGSPIITVRDWRAGLAEVAELISDRSALTELHTATATWWRAVCSEQATAEFMLQRIAAATGILESR
jgi:hypothetical protein